MSKVKQDYESVVEENLRLKQENQRLLEENHLYLARCQYIHDLGFDYDGYSKSESLKDLIDELVDISQGKSDEWLKQSYVLFFKDN